MCGKWWDLPRFVDVLSVNMGFSRLFICLLIKPPLFGWKSAIFLDFHRGWPCGKASAPVLWWRSRSAWFSRLPVESWRNGDAKNGIIMVLRANQKWRIFCGTGDITNYGSVRRIRLWNKQQVGMNCPKGIAYCQKKCQDTTQNTEDAIQTQENEWNIVVDKWAPSNWSKRWCEHGVYPVNCPITFRWLTASHGSVSQV